MNLRIFALIGLLFLSSLTWADEGAPASDPSKIAAAAAPVTIATPIPDTWKKQVIASLTLSQASFNNWKQGGTNFISWQGDLHGDFEENSSAINWLNSFKFEYGLTYLDGQGTRKSADSIDLESLYSWKTWLQVNPFVSIAAKTQFDAGFDYSQSPVAQTSAFLDPGYFTETAGLKYVPGAAFNTRLGLALKETVADRFASIYTVNPDTGAVQKELTEVGLSSVSELNWKLSTDSNLTSKLDMFWNGRGLDRTVVEWDNLLAVSLNKIISVNVENDYRYDPVVYNGWQIKETLGIGFAYSLL